MPMAKFWVHFLTLAFLLTLDIALGAPIKSCRQTPHPQVCTRLLSSKKYHHHHPKSPLEFRNLVLKATLDRVIHAYSLASTMNTKHLHKGARVAWADCLEFYDGIIKHINISMAPSASRSDTQTWLSSAITQHESCRDGFAEMKSLSKYRSSPFSDNNISDSISNALAVDNALPPTSSSKKKIKDNWLLPEEIMEGVPHIVVSQDYDTKDFHTISEAVNSLRGRQDSSRVVIQVKAGTYNENVRIENIKSLQNITMIGDGMYNTIVTGSRHYIQDSVSTADTGTFIVLAPGFVAKEMTFENTAGPKKHQAVALRSSSDHSVFYRCRFLGFQDTLYVHDERQFYRDCEIHGTIDFIFGDADAIFQNCKIFVRLPSERQNQLVITAQGRSRVTETSGIVIQNSTILATKELEPVQGQYKIYLGRPWKIYSRTIIMKTEILCDIQPEGWFDWEDAKEDRTRTLYYAEYMNTGRGSDTTKRVRWHGYHALTDAWQAEKYKIGRFFKEDYEWILEAGVPVDTRI